MTYLFNSKFNEQNSNKKLEYKNIFNMENKLKPRQQLLYVRRLNDTEKTIGNIDKQIYDSFNDPNQYFCPTSPVKVGKNIEIKTFEKFQRKRLTRKMTQSSKKNKNSTRNGWNIDKSYITSKNQLQNNIIQNNNYEIIDNNVLKNIFESFRKENTPKKQRKNINLHIDNTPIKINENIEENLPIDLSRSLDYQNRILTVKNDIDKNVKKMSHFISKKINNKEKDLMINKVDLYKYKKEVLKEIANGKVFEDNDGKFVWNTSLRKPENFKGVRQSYINLKNDYDPFWKVVVEKSPNYKELTIRPDSGLDNKEFIKFTHSKDIQKNLGKLKNLKNLDSLSVKGKNLFNLEYEREMSSKGRKILHKVFVENGKIISDQEINNVFGDATLYKNYDNKKAYQGNEEIWQNNDVSHSFLLKNIEGNLETLTNRNIDLYDKNNKSSSRPGSNMLTHN